MGKKYFSFILLSLLLFHIKPLKAQAVFDWHISGGTVVDGTGAFGYRADILLRGDSIAFIGAVSRDTITVRNYADATGKVITPGFIDVHAHGNPLETPEFKNFLAMGVTTILLGQDGSSPTDKSMDQWFSETQEAKPAINIATLSGHGSIRSKAGAGHQPAQGQELSTMRRLLEADLEAGSFGLSTGLEYVPGMYADRVELQKMAEVVGEYGGVLMSHMRSEDDAKIKNSIEELASMGKESRVHISHLKVVYGEGADRAEEVLAFMDSLKKQGIEISADTYPYAASYTGIGIVFPNWAKTKAQWQQAVKERPEILRQYLRDKVKQRNGPGAILFGSGQYAGMTLGEVANKEEKPFVDILMKMGPQGASAAHFVMDEELQDRIAVDPDVVISSDGSPTMHHPRGYGSFAKIISRYVIDQEALTIEEAVHKMSGQAAGILGIDDRGIIEEGKKADLLLFDPKAVKDRATFEEPHKPAEGIKWIWVNGQAARAGSTFNDKRYGEVLRKKH